MKQIIQHLYHAAALMAFFVGGSQVNMTQAFAVTADSSNQPLAGIEVSSEARPEKDSVLALRYAEALAVGRVEEWAAMDLGCLARQQTRSESLTSASAAKACWDDTQAAHRTLVADETESGIFGALGRGRGLGLIHSTHQHADFWKDYPPALALSPTVISQNPTTPLPLLKVVNIFEPQSVGLVVERGRDPVGVRAVKVDISVSYPDPLTAPLALRPGEPWWASPVIRRYGPVQDLLARFTIVNGLHALGFSVDQAVVNEALPNAPLVTGPSVPGILPDSPRWWDRGKISAQFESGFQDARQATSFQDRIRKFQRLLLLDPKEPRVNAEFGRDLYLAFLKEGLAKGKITVNDEAIKRKLAELYWNIQAQTWRQEFTEVAVGHSIAAETFYKAISALETAMNGGKSDPEMRRRLGSLYRWNNDITSALTLHEGLLENVSSNDHARQGYLLIEIVWDRVQWISWNRRYNHPWMIQARKEAEKALNLASAPIDKLIAGEALLVLDALSVSRDQPRLLTHVELVRTWHDQLSGVNGMWSHLVGNELVKSLIPEGRQVKRPDPVRSPEVMPLDVHLRIQDLNFMKTWSFDGERVGARPFGFTAGSTQTESMVSWRIEADSRAPSAPHVVTPTSPCLEEDCFQVLLAEEGTHALPDIVVYLRQVSSVGQGEAGIVLAAKDPRNFYAVTLNPTNKRLSIYRVQNGKPLLLGKGEAELKRGPWHVLRVETVNSAHVDYPRLEIYVDGREVMVMASEPIQERGRIGLVTKGGMVAQFDRLRVIEMVTNRPMSKPAAY